MQGWLFKNDFDFWTADLAKALLTSVPSVRNAQNKFHKSNDGLQLIFYRVACWYLTCRLNRTLNIFDSIHSMARFVLT